MKIKIHTILLFIASTALLSGCEKVLDIDIDISQRHVVVNSLPRADSTLFVNITYSRFFLDNTDFIPVDGATLTLWVNGNEYSPTSHVGANHFFGVIPASGDSLSLLVTVPGRQPITATTRIPTTPVLATPNAEIDTLQPFDSGDIIFTLGDPANEKNYYYVYIMEHDSGSRWNIREHQWDTIDTVAHAYFSCFNNEITLPSVNSSEGIMNYFTSLLFTDSLINGESYEVKLSIPMLKDTAEHPVSKQYRLVVESLSREAYLYFKDVLTSQSMTQYFAEPATTYTNISNDLGIFAGMVRRDYPLVFTYKELDTGANTKKPHTKVQGKAKSFSTKGGQLPDKH